MLLPRPWQMMYLSDSKSLVFPRQAKLPRGEHWLNIILSVMWGQGWRMPGQITAAWCTLQALWKKVAAQFCPPQP